MIINLLTLLVLFSDHHLGLISSERVFVKALLGWGWWWWLWVGVGGRILLAVSLSCNNFVKLFR